jgi:hypothetical protein
MSGAWFALGTVLIGFVIRWLILNDSGATSAKLEKSTHKIDAEAARSMSPPKKKPKRWRAKGSDL